MSVSEDVNQDKSQPRSSWIANILLLAISLLLSVTFIEVALRIVGFSYPLFPEKIQFGAPNPEKIASSFETDPDLFWVPKDYAERLRSIKQTDIVFMGDSCTQNGTYGVELANLVRQKIPGKDISFASLGVTGWTSYQGLQQLKRDILPLKPKIITVYFGWNDHWIGFGIEDKTVASINRSLLYKVRNVRLVQLIQKVYVILSRNGTDAYPKRVSPEDFRDNLRRICQVAKDNGIIPVLLTAPSAHEKGLEPASLASRWITDLEQLVPLHQQYVQIVREVAKQEGAILCDLSLAFEDIPRERIIRELFREDGIHFYGPGDQEIAKNLFECFEREKFWDRLAVPAVEARQFPQNEENVRKVKKVKTTIDTALPSQIVLESATLLPDGTLSITGFVLSPQVVDYVLVVADGQPSGTASYPENRPNILLAHPEYADPNAGFNYARKLSPGLTDVRLEVYSLDSKITELSVKVNRVETMP